MKKPAMAFIGLALCLTASGEVFSVDKSQYGYSGEDGTAYYFTNVAAPSVGGHVVAWGILASVTNVPSVLSSNVLAIAGGLDHCLAIISDTSVVAWGNNADGQTSVPSGLTNVIQVAGGVRWSAALCSDGSVVTWGSAMPTGCMGGLSNIVEIAGSGTNLVVLNTNGSVSVVASNAVYAGPSGAVHVAANSLASGVNLRQGAVLSNGTVALWAGSKTNMVPEATNVIDLALCTLYAYALRGDGSIVRWSGTTNNDALVYTNGYYDQVVAYSGNVYGLASNSVVKLLGPNDPSAAAYPASFIGAGGSFGAAIVTP